MSWNHKDKIFAMGVALQPTPGSFVLPGQAGLIGVSNPQNARGIISAQDPTVTGTIWDAPRVFMGINGTASGTIPLRGYGLDTPPAANVFPMGLILQACGFAELRRAAASTAAALVAGSTDSALRLAMTESSVDDALIGLPIQHPAIGSGFKQTSLIMDYVGATREAVLAETLGAAPAAGTNYIFPAGLTYLLGTLSTAPPLLSISVWRDKVRYDYMDCVITSWGLDIPVSNEQNTTFPSLEFAIKGTPIPRVDATTPSLPDGILNVPVPPAKDGKFFLDRVMLGHVGTKMNVSTETGAASNQNQQAGQDQNEILSGSRTIDLTLNQMNVTDFDIDTRLFAQTEISELSTWGLGVGNRLGMVIPGMVLDPDSPQGTNGYVTLAGQSLPTKLDKSMALAIW